MIKNLNNLYKKLEDYSDFGTDENTQKFLDTVDELVILGDPCSIGQIIHYFDDESDYGWVFQSTIRTMENFDDCDYVQKILENIAILMKKASGLAWEIVVRILNNNNCQAIFRQNIHLADKDSLLKLFDLMEKESPHHTELIAELRKELEGRSN